MSVGEEAKKKKEKGNEEIARNWLNLIINLIVNLIIRN